MRIAIRKVSRKLLAWMELCLTNNEDILKILSSHNFFSFEVDNKLTELHACF